MLAFGTTVETVPHFDCYIFTDLDQLKFGNSAFDRMKGHKIGKMAEGSNRFIGDQRRVCLSEVANFLPESFNYVLLHKNVSEAEVVFLHTNKNWLSPCPTFLRLRQFVKHSIV